MRKNPKLLARLKPKTIGEGKFIRFLKVGSWEFVQRSNCQGIVIIIAMTSDGKVILTEQFRPPVMKKVIEFPAGLVSDVGPNGPRKNESIFTAAKREFFEETGYCAGKMTRIMDGPVSSGLTSDMVTIVMASNLEKTGEGGGDENEQIKVREVPLVKVDSWLKQKQKKGFLVDPKIYAGLYWLKKYNG